MNPTITPATAPPPISATDRANPETAFACGRSARSTIDGRIPVIAGITNAAAIPFNTSITANCQSRACPDSTSAAASAWVSPLTVFATISTRCRGSRSEITPPISRKITFGMLRAASTRPTALALFETSRTAKTRAIGAIEEPSRETKRAETKIRTSRRRSTARSARQLIRSPGVTGCGHGSGGRGRLRSPSAFCQTCRSGPVFATFGYWFDPQEAP